MIAEFTVTAGSGTAATNGTLSVLGFGPWGNARAGLNGDQRGFTGHEHLAELGIIHMNGRLYDAVIGRFLQADPIIQAPQNAQSHNRYGYVMNNPLSFTDPSGFSWWTKNRRMVIGLVAGIATAGGAAWLMSAYGSLAGLVGSAVGQNACGSAECVG
ncbi:MAG: RHS repeat-associated core domain-containing protein [Burkholderiales bacterium]|nr:RHS repeat-associated core domain-containing protein [Burkholderiales bacterium]